jgi:predicted molibdopterin-dependent oxidoreductase YjgC
VKLSFSVSNRPGFISLLLVLVIFVSACQSGQYEETFDKAGDWGTGRTADVVGEVDNGVYEMLVKSNSELYLATAGESFGDGVYEVEATQIAGPLNNGYGFLFNVDEETDSFYVFEISGDGWIWIGRCVELCDSEQVALVGGDWFRSPAINQGLQATNVLRAVVDGNLMTFYVNGVEVGRTSDDRLTEGDIAVMVETLGESGVRVIFDNFRFSPQ